MDFEQAYAVLETVQETLCGVETVDTQASIEFSLTAATLEFSETNQVEMELICLPL